MFLCAIVAGFFGRGDEKMQIVGEAGYAMGDTHLAVPGLCRPARAGFVRSNADGSPETPSPTQPLRGHARPGLSRGSGGPPTARPGPASPPQPAHSLLRVRSATNGGGDCFANGVGELRTMRQHLATIGRTRTQLTRTVNRGDVIEGGGTCGG